MQSIAISTAESSPGRNKWMLWLIPPAGALVAMGVFWALTRPSGAGGATSAGAGVVVVPASSGSFYSVHPMDMDVKIAKSGELQAVNNIEIQCRVEGGSTIQTLVKEGASVKKG